MVGILWSRFWIILLMLCGYASAAINKDISKQSHVCFPGHDNPCCAGWSQRPHTLSDAATICDIAICSRPCGFGGECVAPDLCRCTDGSLQLSCQPEQKAPTFDSRLDYYKRKSRRHRKPTSTLAPVMVKSTPDANSIASVNQKSAQTSLMQNDPPFHTGHITTSSAATTKQASSSRAVSDKGPKIITGLFQSSHSSQPQSNSQTSANEQPSSSLSFWRRRLADTKRPSTSANGRINRGNFRLPSEWLSRQRRPLQTRPDRSHVRDALEARGIPILQQDEGFNVEASLRYIDSDDDGVEKVDPLTAPRSVNYDPHGADPYQVEARLEYENHRNTKTNQRNYPNGNIARTDPNGNLDPYGYQVDARLVYNQEETEAARRRNPFLSRPVPANSAEDSRILSSIVPFNPCSGDTSVSDCSYDFEYPYYYYNPCDYQCPEGTDCPPCEFDYRAYRYNGLPDYPCLGEECGTAAVGEPCAGGDCNGALQPCGDEGCLRGPDGVLPPCDGDEGCLGGPEGVLPPCEDGGCLEVPEGGFLPCGDEGCLEVPNQVLPPCEDGGCLEVPEGGFPPCGDEGCLGAPDQVLPPCEDGGCLEVPEGGFPPCGDEGCLEVPNQVLPLCEDGGCLEVPEGGFPPCGEEGCLGIPEESFPPCQDPNGCFGSPDIGLPLCNEENGCPDISPCLEEHGCITDSALPPCLNEGGCDDTDPFPPCFGNDCITGNGFFPPCPEGADGGCNDDILPPCFGPECDSTLPLGPRTPEGPCLWPECDLTNPHHHVESIEHVTPDCLNEGGCDDGAPCPPGEYLIPHNGFMVCQSLWDVISACGSSGSPDNPLLTTKDCTEKLRLLKAGRLAAISHIQNDARIQPIDQRNNGKNTRRRIQPHGSRNGGVRAYQRGMCEPACANGGTCIAGECLCVIGYTGAACQHEKSCSPVCQNGGVCERGRCVCAAGFTGPSCSIDLDECRASPCAHRCFNTRGSYQCACQRGYRLNTDRHTCTKSSEVCFPGCDNGGECRNNRCHCPPGYHGNSCQLDVDECLASPCSQRCINLRGSYYCRCHHGYIIAPDRTTCVLRR